MPNNYFAFKNFTVYQDRCAMKVTTDACLFGAWCAQEIAKENNGVKKLLDIGTGTGLLSLMVAQKANVSIDAVEINKNAAQQAAENTKNCPTKIHIHHTDILQFEGVQFDCIVSNPPFYEDDLVSPSLGRSLAHHHHGLTWKNLFKIIGEKLAPQGKFFLLLPVSRFAWLQNLINTNGLFIEKEVAVHHSPHHKQTRLMIQGSKQRNDTIYDKIFIKEGDAYSPKFINLLKDYYLYL